jgi:nucleotide-binding universal stress UspA family protein
MSAPTGRLEAELGRAELLGQNVLVLAAASESMVCRQFFRAWYGLGEPNVEGARGLTEVANQFVLLAVDTTRTRRPVTIRTILERSQLAERAVEDAGLAILRSDGEVLATTSGGSLSSDGKLDAEKLAAFLSRLVPPLRDAEKLLADALAEAKRLGKRVLVFQGVPLSAPSALISLWLESQGELLAKDYVCVTLAERYANGAAAIRRAGDAVSAEPWVAILDESGKRLAEPAGKPVGAAQIEEMFRATARTLTEEDIQTIVSHCGCRNGRTKTAKLDACRAG